MQLLGLVSGELRNRDALLVESGLVSGIFAGWLCLSVSDISPKAGSNVINRCNHTGTSQGERNSNFKSSYDKLCL